MKTQIIMKTVPCLQVDLFVTADFHKLPLYVLFQNGCLVHGLESVGKDFSVSSSQFSVEMSFIIFGLSRARWLL